MDDTFKIFVHRLRDGRQEQVEETLASDFLDIHEADLAFSVPVRIKGQATMTDETLVLILSIETEATIPCAICNQNTQFKISIKHFCHTVPLAEIKGGIFDYRQALREAILIELPYTTECNSGNCPERALVAKYIASKGDNYGSTT